MILISSAAYVISEFQAELGKIPPCFLPLGNKKLLEHQVAVLRKSFPEEIILISLPESYQLSGSEIRMISELGVTSVSIPDDFSLAESITYALNISNTLPANHMVRILYGDTLIQDFPHVSENQDLLGVARSPDSYDWKIEEDSDEPLVWCGFYSFTSKPFLLRCLALSRRNFIDAVDLYRKEKPLQIHEFLKWFDLGHVNTYFRSRASITTQRAFNELRIEKGVVHKTGLPSLKIQAEGLWFKNIPKPLKVFIPQLIDQYLDQKQLAHYELEYLPNMPLNELFVHGKNTEVEWVRLFTLIKDFLNKANVSLSESEEKKIESNFIQLIQEKTFLRLEQYSKDRDFDIYAPIIYQHIELPSLVEMCKRCVKLVLALPKYPSVLHGDLCFSNILYDSRAFQVKVIDPRGINTKNEFTIYGDQKYDLAKLTHSVIGFYDHIIAGRYILNESLDNGSMDLNFDIDDRTLRIQERFKKFEFIRGLTVQQIMPLVILLFISMLPLHNDRPDRQKAMLANAARLFKLYIN